MPINKVDNMLHFTVRGFTQGTAPFDTKRLEKEIMESIQRIVDDITDRTVQTNVVFDCKLDVQ